MDELYQKNEYETNEKVSRAIRYLYLFILLIGILCWLHIFNISDNMINGFVLMSLLPTLLPTLLVDILHISKPWVKYILMLTVILLSGIAYVIFTFLYCQALNH